MSICATNWAWSLTKKRIKGNEKLVLLSMADRADEEFECWPSKERLITDTCLDRHTVFSALLSLEEKGLIERTGRKRGYLNRVDVYKLIGVKGREEIVNSPKNGTINPPCKINRVENPTIDFHSVLNSGENPTINHGENPTTNSGENHIQNLSVEPISGTYHSSLGDSANAPCVETKVSKKIKGDYSTDGLFMMFYYAYPKKQKPHDAHKAFLRLKLTAVEVKDIVEDVKNRTANDDHWQEKRYIPYPATYLNARQWESEISNFEQERAQAKIDAVDKAAKKLAAMELRSQQERDKPFQATKDALAVRKLKNDPKYAAGMESLKKAAGIRS